MADVTVQTLAAFTGLNDTKAAAATTQAFTNDGNTFLEFLNGNASARTLTITQNATDKPGFGSITPTALTVTIPGSGTNGGLCKVGRFPTARFNDSSNKVNYTIDVVTGLTVSAISLTPVA
jgi:hypothetical protein